MTTGVMMYCFNTEFYRYDKIAAKTIPLVKKNLGVEVTLVTNMETYKLLPPLGFVNYVLIDHETGNQIDRKPWHNLDRHRAYNLSPYDTTILLDLDYFCFTDHLLTYANTNEDFLIHDKVYDITGKDSYEFRNNSIIPMLWATVIVFKKTDRAKKIFDMVKYIKENYGYFCSLYRIDFKNFRNDYAFAIALHQMDGMVPTKKIPVSLPTLPARAKVVKFDQESIVWEMEDKTGIVYDTDVHVIDKGVAHV
tara:strand:+ start:285 stop:1034 length:750 start_codon:yes stop_codon:yes gene_type:complete